MEIAVEFSGTGVEGEFRAAASDGTSGRNRAAAEAASEHVYDTFDEAAFSGKLLKFLAEELALIEGAGYGAGDGSGERALDHAEHRFPDSFAESFRPGLLVEESAAESVDAAGDSTHEDHVGELAAGEARHFFREILHDERSHAGGDRGRSASRCEGETLADAGANHLDASHTEIERGLLPSVATALDKFVRADGQGSRD